MALLSMIFRPLKETRIYEETSKSPLPPPPTLAVIVTGYKRKLNDIVSISIREVNYRHLSAFRQDVSLSICASEGSAYAYHLNISPFDEGVWEDL